MSKTDRCRFVQASNLALGSPCVVTHGIPGSLRAPLLDATFRAAEQVFETALERDVDFVLLAGGVFAEEEISLRAWDFLLRQFRRLQKASIAVIWSEPGYGIASSCPKFLEFPPNIFVSDCSVGHSFRQRSRSGRIIALRTGCDLQQLARLSRHDVSSETTEIALFPVERVPDRIPESGYAYWALRGQSVPSRLESVSGENVVVSGTPQGRSPEEVGPRGCFVSTISESGEVTAEFVETAAIRWHIEHLSVDAETRWNDLCDQFERRFRAIRNESTSEICFVRWIVEGHGLVFERLLRLEVLSQLQTRFSQSSPSERAVVWSYQIEVQPDSVQESEWLEDESAMGAFVRSLEELIPEDSPSFVLRQESSSPDPPPEKKQEVPTPHFSETIKKDAKLRATDVLSRDRS